MSDDNQTGENQENESQVENEPVESELDALKRRAEQMGITYHPNIGVDKLKAKINDKLANDSAPESNEPEPVVAESPDEEAETDPQRRVRKLREAGLLRRIRLTCMNPMKSEWQGEIFTAGNGTVGNFKKYVPYETEWHVPQIILNMIEQRQYQTFYTVRDKRTGQQGRKGKLVKEYAIEYLPDLTEQELKDLAQRQAMSSGTSAE